MVQIIVIHYHFRPGWDPTRAGHMYKVSINYNTCEDNVSGTQTHSFNQSFN